MAILYFPQAAGTGIVTGLSSDTKPAGVPDGMVFIETDTGATATASGGSWGANAAGGPHVHAHEVDFGDVPVASGSFSFAHAEATPSSLVVAGVSYEAPTGKDLDELEMDDLSIRASAGDGVVNLLVSAADGSYLAGKFRINCTIS